MKLHIKSFIYLSVIFAVTLGISVSVIVTTFSGYSARLNDDRNVEINRIISYSFETMTQNLSNLLSGYAYWHDIDLHLAAKDYTWIKENATSYLVQDPNYDIDLLYFRSDRHTYKEYYGNLPIKKIESLKINDDIRSGKLMSSSFQIIDHEIYLFVAAPLTDNNKQHPDGIFILGRLIDNKLMEQLAVLLSAKGVANLGFEILPNPVPSTHVDIDSDRQKYYYPLAAEANSYGYLTVETTSQFIQNLINGALKNVLLSVILMASLAMVLIFMLFYNTSRHLKTCAQTIDTIAQGHYEQRLDLQSSLEFVQLSNSINKLASDFQMTLEQLGDNYLEIISMMIKIIEVTDHYTRGHSERVSHYAVAIATEMGYEDIETIRISGLMHDIGKIAIDGAILNKASELTPHELDWIRSHPTVAYKILDLSNLFTQAKEIILHHHEYYDGKGYPGGLSGDAIPLASRILCVADAFDAMTSDRSYRPAIGVIRAIEIIHSASGSQFDPDVVTAFEKIALKIYSDWSYLDQSPSVEELTSIKRITP